MDMKIPRIVDAPFVALGSQYEIRHFDGSRHDRRSHGVLLVCQPFVRPKYFPYKNRTFGTAMVEISCISLLSNQ